VTLFPSSRSLLRGELPCYRPGSRNTHRLGITLHGRPGSNFIKINRSLSVPLVSTASEAVYEINSAVTQTVIQNSPQLSFGRRAWVTLYLSLPFFHTALCKGGFGLVLMENKKARRQMRELFSSSHCLCKNLLRHPVLGLSNERPSEVGSSAVIFSPYSVSL